MALGYRWLRKARGLAGLPDQPRDVKSVETGAAGPQFAEAARKGAHIALVIGEVRRSAQLILSYWSTSE